MIKIKCSICHHVFDECKCDLNADLLCEEIIGDFDFNLTKYREQQILQETLTMSQKIKCPMCNYPIDKCQCRFDGSELRIEVSK